MTKSDLHTLATIIKNERNQDGESPDYCRGAEAIAKEIAWLMIKDLRVSPDTATKRADDFLATCRML